MSVLRVTLAAAAFVATTVSANPLGFPTLVKRYDAGQCNNQSCIVANIAGNTGKKVSTDPANYPVGDTYSGDCCVITLNPAVRSLAYQFDPKLQQCDPSYDKRDLTAIEEMSADHAALAEAMREIRDAMPEEEYAALLAPQDLEKRACSDKILIYAKGTFEPGPLGVTIGPMLQKALAKYAGWTVQGVNYNPSVAGDYCLGLPGGIAAKQLLTSVAASCPQSKILMSGYSQGAMVVRNGLGNSTSQKRVSGLLTFGDPFEGSPVKGYKGPIQVYCNAKDGVCEGQFLISGAHLSYSGDVSGAAAILDQMASA